MQVFKIKTAELLEKTIQETFGQDIGKSEIIDMLEYPPDLAMGDVALPCFKLSRTLKSLPL